MNATTKNIAERGGIIVDRQRGFSLVSAVFLLVVLAALGAAMVNFATVEHASSALDIQGSRAYQAARAGIEWGLYQGLPNPTSSCSATKTFVPPAPTLSAFTVTVTCASTVASNITAYKTVDTLTATACNQPSGGVCPNATPGAGYVQRVVTITFSVP